MALFLFIIGCQQKPAYTTEKNEGFTIIDYLDKQPKHTKPQIFLPQQVSTSLHEHAGVIAPDLQHFYFTVSNKDYSNFEIKSMKVEDSIWSKPETTSFSGEFTDHAVAFSNHGDTMYFSSTRPKVNLIDWDIWFLTKSSEGWSSPQKLDSTINSSYLESHVSVTKNGKIFFHANYEKGEYWSDIYFAEIENGRYLTPVKLDQSINTDKIEVTPFVSPDEQYLIFAGYDYEQGYGSGDLYISFKNPDGKWDKAINMGDRINTADEESNPHVSPDGRYLFFSSTRPPRLSQGETAGGGGMDIYWISTQIIEDLRSKR